MNYIGSPDYLQCRCRCNRILDNGESWLQLNITSTSLIHIAVLCLLVSVYVPAILFLRNLYFCMWKNYVNVTI